MQRLFYLGILLSLSACHWFTPKEELKASYVATQLKTIDWEAVDQLPLFDTCDETLSKDLQQICFEQLIKEKLSELIKEMNAVDSLSFAGSFSLSIRVDAQGYMRLEPLKNPPFNPQIQSHFEFNLAAKFKNMKAMAPALKQGIPVATRFEIPIEIHLD